MCACVCVCSAPQCVQGAVLRTHGACSCVWTCCKRYPTPEPAQVVGSRTLPRQQWTGWRNIGKKTKLHRRRKENYWVAVSTTRANMLTCAQIFNIIFLAAMWHVWAHTERHVMSPACLRYRMHTAAWITNTCILCMRHTHKHRHRHWCVRHLIPCLCPEILSFTL